MTIHSRQLEGFGKVHDCPRCDMSFTMLQEAVTHLDLDHNEPEIETEEDA